MANDDSMYNKYIITKIDGSVIKKQNKICSPY